MGGQMQLQSQSDHGPKAELMEVLPHLLGKADVKKEDVTYEMSEQGGKWTATLTVPGLPGDKSEFKGNPASSKREAQANAAQKALKLLSKEAKAAKAAAASKKKEKNQEKNQEFFAKKKEKQAEKKAAAEAAKAS